MVENLRSVLEEIATLAAERPLAASEYDLFGDQFKEKLLSQIVDAEEFVSTEMGKFGESAARPCPEESSTGPRQVNSSVSSLS